MILTKKEKMGEKSIDDSLDFVNLRVETVVETKLDFKLAKTTGHCSTVHGKFFVL